MKEESLLSSDSNRGWLAMSSSTLKFAQKVTHTTLKNAEFDQYLLITSEL